MVCGCGEGKAHWPCPFTSSYPWQAKQCASHRQRVCLKELPHQAGRIDGVGRGPQTRDILCAGPCVPAPLDAIVDDGSATLAPCPLLTSDISLLKKCGRATGATVARGPIVQPRGNRREIGNRSPSVIYHWITCAMKFKYRHWARGVAPIRHRIKRPRHWGKCGDASRQRACQQIGHATTI